MKLNLKRFLAYLLTVLMLVSVVPTSAIAEISAASNASASIHSIMPDQGVYVTFEFYVDDKPVDTQIVKEGGSVTRPETPEKAGQKFLGWFDENGDEFNFGTVTGYTDNTTVKLTARFEEKIYHVYFLSVDGEEVVATRDASEATGWKVDLPTDYEPQDKRVTGWIYNDGDFTENTVVTEDVYVSPVTVDCYWVTFDAQGGEVVTSKSVDKGNTLNLSGITSKKTGYTLKGWALTPDGETVSSVTPTEKVTLYAIWEAANVNYTVVYWGENANDTEFGTFLGTETKQAKTGSQVTVSSNQAKKIDYFTYKESDQNVEVKADGSTVVNVRYTRNVYKVTFDLHEYDRRDDVTPDGATMTVGGTSYTKNGTKYVLEAKYEQNIENLWPTAANFKAENKFYGWSIPGEKSTAVSKKVTMTADLCNSNGITATANYGTNCLDHLYYMFESFDQTSPENGNERKRYNGVYYDKSTAYSQDVNSSGGDWNQKEISGMTAVGTDQEILKGYWGVWGYVPTERNVFLYYDREVYDFVKNNYGVTQTEHLKYETPLDDKGGEPARPAGFTENAQFKGWYLVPVEQITESTLPYNFEGATLPLGGLILYAYWVEPDITLTVEAEGFDAKSSDSPARTKISDFTGFQEMETAINTAGKSVLKWYIEGDASKTRIDTELAIEKDTTIVAVFVGTTYQITYDAGEGSGEVTDDYKYAPDGYAKVKSGKGLAAPAGKAFAYWKDEAGNRYYPGSTIQMVGDVELTAVYTPVYEKVTLTYHSNFGEEETTRTFENLPNNTGVEILDYDDSDLSMPARAGYTFTGWNTAQDGTGESFEAGSSARLEGQGNDLYAQWTANDQNYTVEFYYEDVNGNFVKNDGKTATRTAKTDEPVAVTEGDKAETEGDKYVFDADNADNKLNDVIPATGTLVLKLYFKLNTAEYTIHHYLKGTEVKVAPDQTGTKTIGEKLTAGKSDKLNPGYEKAVVDSYSPEKEITIAATDNEITVYYTVPLTIKAEDATKQYDGTELTQPDFTVTGRVNRDTKSMFTLSMTAASTITNVGTQPNVIDQSTVKYNNGTIPSYYTVTYVDDELKVTPVTDEVLVTIVGNTETFTYDGTEKTAEGYTVTTNNPLYTEKDFKFSGTKVVTGVDADTYQMGLKAEQFTNTSKNFEKVKFVVTDGSLEINPVEIELTAKSAEKEYDGTPLTDDGYDVTKGKFVEGEGLESVTVVGSQTLVGSSENKITGHELKENTKKQNYAITYQPGTLTVKNRTTQYEITVKANSGEKVYDGTPLTVKGFETLTFTVNEQTYTVEGLTASKTGTNVSDIGAVEVEGTAIVRDAQSNDVTAQFKVTTVDGMLTIKARPITITAKDNTVQYDGRAHGENGYEVAEATETTGLANGHEVDSVTIIGNKVEVGTYKDLLEPTTATIVDAQDEDVTQNYAITYVAGTLTITKRGAGEKKVKVIANDNTVTYDGQAHGEDGYTTERLVEGHKVSTVTIDGSKTDVGTYTDLLVPHDATIVDAQGNDVTKNYEITYVAGTLKIEPKKVTITAKDKSKVYDGDALTQSEFTATALEEGDTHKFAVKMTAESSSSASSASGM